MKKRNILIVWFIIVFPVLTFAAAGVNLPGVKITCAKNMHFDKITKKCLCDKGYDKENFSRTCQKSKLEDSKATTTTTN
jgi:hypothetical protein